jgi:hypothetical protein
MLSHFFVPDPEMFPQREDLKLEADNEFISRNCGLEICILKLSLAVGSN